MTTSLRGTLGFTGGTRDRGRVKGGGLETEMAAGRDRDKEQDMTPAGATTEAKLATYLKTENRICLLDKLTKNFK